jgi:hypothetical protein
MGNKMQSWYLCAIYFGSPYIKGEIVNNLILWGVTKEKKYLSISLQYIEDFITLLDTRVIEMTDTLHGNNEMQRFISEKNLSSDDADLIKSITFSSGISTLKVSLLLIKNKIKNMGDDITGYPSDEIID